MTEWVHSASLPRSDTSSAPPSGSPAGFAVGTTCIHCSPENKWRHKRCGTYLAINKLHVFICKPWLWICILYLPKNPWTFHVWVVSPKSRPGSSPPSHTLCDFPAAQGPAYLNNETSSCFCQLEYWHNKFQLCFHRFLATNLSRMRCFSLYSWRMGKLSHVECLYDSNCFFFCGSTCLLFRNVIKSVTPARNNLATFWVKKISENTFHFLEEKWFSFFFFTTNTNSRQQFNFPDP